MSARESKRQWPPIPGDFEIGNPGSPIAICTLGKKLDIQVDYAIIGTCKTENIGIERMIANTISNPSIRFFILAGPEIPGHKTGSSIRSLFSRGVDTTTRRIVDAEGAIPYLENLPLEAIDRFRSQVTLVDLINVLDVKTIADRIGGLPVKSTERLPEEPMWIDFGRRASPRPRPTTQSSAVSVIPEYGLVLDPVSSLLHRPQSAALITMHPSRLGAEMRTDDRGTVLIAKEM